MRMIEDLKRERRRAVPGHAGRTALARSSPDGSRSAHTRGSRRCDHASSLALITRRVLVNGGPGGWLVVIGVAILVGSAFGGISTGFALLAGGEATVIALVQFLRLPLSSPLSTCCEGPDAGLDANGHARYNPLNWGVERPGRPSSPTPIGARSGCTCSTCSCSPSSRRRSRPGCSAPTSARSDRRPGRLSWEGRRPRRPCTGRRRPRPRARGTARGTRTPSGTGPAGAARRRARRSCSRARPRG